MSELELELEQVSEQFNSWISEKYSINGLSIRLMRRLMELSKSETRLSLLGIRRKQVLGTNNKETILEAVDIVNERIKHSNMEVVFRETFRKPKRSGSRLRQWLFSFSHLDLDSEEEEIAPLPEL